MSTRENIRLIARAPYIRYHKLLNNILVPMLKYSYILIYRILNFKSFECLITFLNFKHPCNLNDVRNAPVICMPRPLGDIAGLKCRDLTYDVTRQCHGLNSPLK